MSILALIVVLIFIILSLIIFAVMQIKMAGMNIKDFWDFIQANDLLDRLYEFSKKYDKLTPEQQIIFLIEAEKVFSAFDKVPNMLWEEEYSKYGRVLDKYKEIKMDRWNVGDGSFRSNLEQKGQAF